MPKLETAEEEDNTIRVKSLNDPETNATAATPDATAGATTDATADATTDATADATANATAGGFPDAAGVTVVCSFGLLLDIKEQADLSKILL